MGREKVIREIREIRGQNLLWNATPPFGQGFQIADLLQGGPRSKSSAGWQPVPDFQGTSDSSGLAVIPNLPKNVAEFSVEHARFALPAVVTTGGDKRRQASITLIPGQTNRVSVRLEPRDESPITHY